MAGARYGGHGADWPVGEANEDDWPVREVMRVDWRTGRV